MHGLLLAACCVVSGFVHAPSGAPIAHVRVTLEGTRHVETTTDTKGTFATQAPPGRYDLTAGTRGYAVVTVGLTLDRDSHVDVALEPTDSPRLRTIGEVTVNGDLTLVRNAIPEINVPRSQFDDLGYDNIISGLEEIPSVNIQRPDAGAPTAPAVASLRGPDPSEALITLDGQVLNDGNTGDVDLSRFPVAAFSSVNVTEGLGPEDSEGSNTFGGAINFVSLRPTQQDHVNVSSSVGSYGQTDSWLNATGTIGRLGYALAGSDFHEAGMTDQTNLVVPFNNTPISCSGSNPNCPFYTHLGSSISSWLGLVNLDYSFSQRADVGVRVFSLANVRDESSAVNGIAGNPWLPCAPTALDCSSSGFIDQPNPEYNMHVGAGSAVFAQNIRAYEVHSQSVLGSGSLVANFSASDDNVDFSGATGVSPYDVAHRDTRYNEGLSWGRTFDDGEFSFGGYARQEGLSGVGITGTPSLSINTFYARGSKQITSRLRLSGGAYQARYSNFGSSLNGRLGASYDLDSSSVLHASFGTGFRAPLLLEQYYFAPVEVDGHLEPNPGLPPKDSNCVVAGQGNPNEKAEHATEYEFGYSHLFPTQSQLDVSLYRSNLRDTIENFYPLGNYCNIPPGFAYEYPINIGNAVYEGAEVRLHKRFPRQHLFMILQYGLNVAYPENLGANVSNPTSGGSLVDNQQFLSIPQQQFSGTLMWAQGGWHAATSATFFGNNNELNQAPFTTVDAAAGKSFGPVDVTVAATNIFNAVSGPFTYYMAGTPYRGLLGPNTAPYFANLPTNRLFIEPAAIRLIVTVHG